MARPLRAELRDQLLATAARQFAERGLAGVQLDSIAAELGVTKGAVYFHFRGKLALFLQTLDQLERMRDETMAQIPPTQDPVEALRRFLLARLEFYLAHPELRRLHWILDTELRDEVAAAVRDGIRADYRQFRGELRQLVQRAARAGLVDLTDPAEEAFRLAACLEGALSQHVAAPDDVSLFLNGERLVDSWIAPLRPRRRRRPSVSGEPERSGEDFQPAF